MGYSVMYHYRFVGQEDAEFPSLAGELVAGASLSGEPIETQTRPNARLTLGDEIELSVAVHHPWLEPMDEHTQEATDALEHADDDAVPGAGPAVPGDGSEVTGANGDTTDGPPVQAPTPTVEPEPVAVPPLDFHKEE